MEIVVTGRHTQIKQRFRDVVESKMNRVTAIAPDAQRVQIVLSHEGNPRQADTAKFAARISKVLAAALQAGFRIDFDNVHKIIRCKAVLDFHHGTRIFCTEEI